MIKLKLSFDSKDELINFLIAPIFPTNSVKKGCDDEAPNDPPIVPLHLEASSMPHAAEEDPVRRRGRPRKQGENTKEAADEICVPCTQTSSIKVTREQVSGAIKAAYDRVDLREIVNLLAEYNATNASNLKVENYAEFMVRCEALK